MDPNNLMQLTARVAISISSNFVRGWGSKRSSSCKMQSYENMYVNIIPTKH